ncbi:hypothetical protein FVEN_g864 [Fusarium venenatum]|uniref:F-box domain-containing protein n=1 Tax=Fusarium venenatum TaxID=56646 RepID=A0A2L2TKP0_9HYPO|nr:uncharacterized protein FVRRES_10726 [Fusarium venenatum]KAG8361252.1 hypothetical protein FVEN_g864 [Fusarium venenatum]KAH6967309.1 hypothetical protein EDB82DRAFT_356195 [Fusarium venenatum]CEI70649.1 unnamed protein product [Fusarium venenatum]
MEQAPGEILDLIIGQLFDYWHKKDLYQARLVCRRWNQHAIRHFFSTVTLFNKLNTIENDFQSWNNLMGLQTAKDNVRHVVIEICSRDIGRRHHPGWDLWEEQGEWPAFTSAVDRIINLDHLQTIGIEFCFSEMICTFGPSYEEMRSARKAALEAICRSVKQREERRFHGYMAKISPISELRLENLQNTDPAEVLANGLFKDIRRLEIEFVIEPNPWQEGSGGLAPLDRFDFNRILEYTMLSPVVDQLVELDLSSIVGWGLFPSPFSGKSLLFPNLKRLYLRDFLIGRYDQLDWVLNQKNLSCLRLRNCWIVTHFHLRESVLDLWTVNTDDWERFDGGPWLANYSDDEDDNSHFYRFNLRWKTLFENIREGLPNLTAFSAAWTTDHIPYTAPSTKDMKSRYMSLGELDADCGFHRIFGDKLQNDNDPESPWNLDDSNFKMDARALAALLQATIERRKQ